MGFFSLSSPKTVPPAVSTISPMVSPVEDFEEVQPASPPTPVAKIDLRQRYITRKIELTIKEIEAACDAGKRIYHVEELRKDTIAVIIAAIEHAFDNVTVRPHSRNYGGVIAECICVEW